MNPFVLYKSAISRIVAGKLTLATDTFNIILLTKDYEPDIDADDCYSSVKWCEVASGRGYVSGGILLPETKLLDVAGRTRFTSSIVEWDPLNATFRYAVIVRRVGTTLEPDDVLLCYLDIGDISTDTRLKITPSPDGIFGFS